MDKSDFTDWKENPVTCYFLKYLKDSAQEEASMLADLIVGGDVVSEIEQAKVATLSMTLIHISEIEYEEITEFYTE